MPIRPALFGSCLLVLVTLGCSRSTVEPTTKPFTREGVVKELSAKFPNVSLPSDELPSGVVAHEGIVYVSRVEGPLVLDIYEPQAEGRHPAVIVVHGGGWETGDRTMERPLAKRLAALGYVAVPVDYRLGVEGRFPKPLYDLKSAVRFLRGNAGRYGLDPARIGAIGGSSGGQLVALLGATNGDRDFDADGWSKGDKPEPSSAVRAVVDIDGLADFTGPALLAKEAQNPGAPVRFLGGSYATRAAVWRAASPLFHVGPASAHTLFINSSAPTPILPGRPEMQVKLIALGIDSETLLVPNTPHPFWLVNPWFEPTLAAADRFLRAHLR